MILSNFYQSGLVSQVTGDGRYCLVLVFEAKDLQLSDFEKRQVTENYDPCLLFIFVICREAVPFFMTLQVCRLLSIPTQNIIGHIRY